MLGLIWLSSTATTRWATSPLRSAAGLPPMAGLPVGGGVLGLTITMLAPSPAPLTSSVAPRILSTLASGMTTRRAIVSGSDGSARRNERSGYATSTVLA